jgi:hypothetical protein
MHGKLMAMQSLIKHTKLSIVSMGILFIAHLYEAEKDNY